MPSIVREISEWGSTLPYWEQAALEKIVTGTAITDDILDELLQYLLEDADLVPRTTTRPALRFSLEATDENDSEQHNRVRLKSVFNLCNINALVPKQSLEFGPQLTMVFGSNGSGKSGYARVIASASFTRGDKQILRDVTKPANTDEPLSADIQLEIEGKPLTIHHEIGQVCQEMHSFYVFDSTSVRAHLTRSNPMSFAPAGLEYLTRLAEVTDSVRKRLQQQIDQLNCTNSFSALFANGDTPVAQAINNLGSKTNIALLQGFATLSAEEIGRIAELDMQIAQLKSTNIPEQISELDQTIADLNLLVNALKHLGETLNNSQIDGILQSIRAWTGLNDAAQSLSIEQFESPVFTKVGSEVWYDFIKAAYALATAETATGYTYPDKNSSCLLCHQPLDPDARELLKRLWAFLTSDIQAKLDQEEQALRISSQALQLLEFDLLDDQAVSYRHLQDQDPHVLRKAQQFIQACSFRQNNLLVAIQNRAAIEITPLPDDGVRDIDHVIGCLSAKRDELANRKVTEEIQRLGQEKLELDHRKLLSDIIEEVVHFIKNAQWIEVASSGKVKRSTAPISKKYNDLFDRLVTQEYVRLFQDTLVKLNCPLQVQITTRAQKGTTIKQITLQTDVSIAPEQAPPDKVLSEGEQRAVALADFFTEVRLDK